MVKSRPVDIKVSGNLKVVFCVCLFVCLYVFFCFFFCLFVFCFVFFSFEGFFF